MNLIDFITKIVVPILTAILGFWSGWQVKTIIVNKNKNVIDNSNALTSDDSKKNIVKGSKVKGSINQENK